MQSSAFKISYEESKHCGAAIADLNNEISLHVRGPVGTLLGVHPEELKEFFLKINEVNQVLSASSPTADDISVPAHVLPLIKSALLLARNTVARRVENQASKAKDPAVLGQIRAPLASLDQLLRDRFTAVEPERVPRLTDFITIQQAENSIATRDGETLKKRVFDDKFNILLSPSLVSDDLEYFRLRCSLRDVPISVGFIDIDCFKRFNAKYTETVVDAVVLPHFMSALEAHMFGRGYAYKQGGDEYIVICPNLDAHQIASLLSDFQKKLQDLKLPEVDDTITVSIGVCTANSDCPLTDQELIHKASQAQQVAKELGRDKVFGFPGPNYGSEDGVELSGQILGR